MRNFIRHKPMWRLSENLTDGENYIFAFLRFPKVTHRPDQIVLNLIYTCTTEITKFSYVKKVQK